MNMEIAGVHYHVSEATKEHIEERVESFKKMHHLLERIHVSITQNGAHAGYDVHLHGKLNWHHAPLIEVHRMDSNLWHALDVAFDALEVSLLRHKDKHLHVSHERIQM
jgi:ribosomal subunit interface protein